VITCLNFRIEGIELQVAGQTLNLHDQFVFAGHCYSSAEQVLTLQFALSAEYAGRAQIPKPPSSLSLVFRQVSFLQLKHTPIDPANVRFDSLTLGEGVAFCLPEAFLAARPDQVMQTGDRCFGLYQAPLDWSQCAYIHFIWGVALLVSAQTVEVSFAQAHA
jgi:hypothetical protein